MIVKENKTETTIKNYDAQEMLQYLIMSGRIDLSNVQNEIEMDKRDKILEQHKYPIWQGSNARWYTYLLDDTKKNGRKQIAKSTKEKVEDASSRTVRNPKRQKQIRQSQKMKWQKFLKRLTRSCRRHRGI